MQERPYEAETPPSLENTEYNWEWFNTEGKSMTLATPIFTREHLIVLSEMVEQARNDEIPVNQLLAYMSPSYKGNIGSMSQVETLGYFIDQMTRTLDPTLDLQCLWDISHQLTTILEAVNPSKGIPELQDENLTAEELIANYVEKVEVMFDELEANYDPDDILHFYPSDFKF
jgi:hypothetical protein